VTTGGLVVVGATVVGMEVGAVQAAPFSLLPAVAGGAAAVGDDNLAVPA
jgi:hypothetical protein